MKRHTVHGSKEARRPGLKKATVTAFVMEPRSPHVSPLIMHSGSWPSLPRNRGGSLPAQVRIPPKSLESLAQPSQPSQPPPRVLRALRVVSGVFLCPNSLTRAFTPRSTPHARFRQISPEITGCNFGFVVGFIWLLTGLLSAARIHHPFHFVSPPFHLSTILLQERQGASRIRAWSGAGSEKRSHL